MKISIIIPTYNEAAVIVNTLSQLLDRINDSSTTEIILVDGGSTDDTMLKAKAYSEVKRLNAPRGRGAQMNFAAQRATGMILYFLHADSLPPQNFDKYIGEKVLQGHQAGCFKMQFDSAHWWLHLAGWFTQFNLKFFRGGDQSLFVTKALFRELNGFPENAPIFEDYQFIRKLYAKKQFVVIQKAIVSSARRYEDNGVARLQFHYWMLYFKKWLGASAEELAIYYTKHVR